MNTIFVTGTDTGVGKTLISAWLCLQLKAAYWKPIQTGAATGLTDTQWIQQNPAIKTYPERYVYQQPVSPHLAAEQENRPIDMASIQLPTTDPLIIEGAGGLLVPLSKQYWLIDLIQQFKAPVILVARTTLGTLNHTLLSLEALASREIPIFGVILNGPPNEDIRKTIEVHGQVPVLLTFPQLPRTPCYV